MTDINQELLGRLKGEDATALREIFETFGSTIYAIAINMVRNERIAEDITHDTFMRLWNDRNIFDHPKQLRTYLFVIAKNACSKHLSNLS